MNPEMIFNIFAGAIAALVILIALLVVRKRRGGLVESSGQRKNEISSHKSPGGETIEVVPESEPVDAILLMKDGNAVGEITRINDPNAYRALSPVPVRNKAHLADAIGKLVPVSSMEFGEQWVVKFKPEVIEAIATDSLEIMPARQTANGVRMIARNSVDKKIAAQGWLEKASKGKQLAGAAFQLVSIAVAQAHLADISKKLGEIKAGIDGITQFIEDDKESKIIGALSYLYPISQRIESGCLPDEITQEERVKIEDVISLILVNKVFVTAQLAPLKHSVFEGDFVGTGNVHQQILEKSQFIEKRVYWYGLLQRLALCVVLVKNHYSPAYLHSLDANRLLDASDMSNLIDQLRVILDVNAKAKIDAVFNTGETLKKRKNEIFSLTKDFSDHYRSSVDETILAVGKISVPEEIVVTLDKNGRLELSF